MDIPNPHTGGCPPGAHCHGPYPPLFLRTGHTLVFDNTVIAIVFDGELIGPRLAELLNRHGLTDIPDTIPTWPAPTGPAHHLEVPHA